MSKIFFIYSNLKLKVILVHACWYQQNNVGLDINSFRHMLSVQNKYVILKFDFFFRNQALKGSDVQI